MYVWGEERWREGWRERERARKDGREKRREKGGEGKAEGESVFTCSESPSWLQPGFELLHFKTFFISARGRGEHGPQQHGMDTRHHGLWPLGANQCVGNTFTLCANREEHSVQVSLQFGKRRKGGLVRKERHNF